MNPAGRQVRAPTLTFSEQFSPKLLTVLQEGYGARELRADALSGLTVAIVALPLSMAIAIASGVTPDRGLYTAVVGGFLVSLLGGSRFQIGGPAGAFIVLVGATVARHGVDGLVLATMLSGFILLALGFLRLGSYVKLVPYPVTVGFTAGIGVIILITQIKELLGLRLEGVEPGPIVEKLQAIGGAVGTANPAAVGAGLATVAIILALRRARPGLPGILIAVALVSLVSGLAGLPVETVGSRFGGIPHTLPWPGLPEVSGERIVAVMPDAIAFAMLGAIESLLSAVVADGMTGRRHRSNCELVAQGAANIGVGLFGGFCVTGTIARTATNVRAGAHGPVSGMLHALFLLAFMLIAAPLASYIPLAALAGVLVVVAVNMVEWQAIRSLATGSRGDAVVLFVTLAVTVLRDLTEAILIGFALGAALFIRRMSLMISVENNTPLAGEDVADFARAGERSPYEPGEAEADGAVVYRISGAFFFGTASLVEATLSRISTRPETLIIDFSTVPLLDSTGAHVLEGLARKLEAGGRRMMVAGASPSVERELVSHGLGAHGVTFHPDVPGALEAHRRRREPGHPAPAGQPPVPINVKGAQ
ncbi:MAG: STAS domain-containing protein [Rhizobiales bacterium]|nr:STAS domain-containing protein [Hyphomicrobiales bacterium]